MFLPHFDVFCDLLLNRPTATWDLFVLYNKEQEATSSLYSGLQKYSEWCMVNLALKKRTERSLSFSHRPYIAILMMFDCVCSEYPDPDYLHYRW